MENIYDKLLHLPLFQGVTHERLEEIIEKITGIVYLVMKIGQILLNEKIGIGIQQWGNQQMMH